MTNAEFLAAIKDDVLQDMANTGILASLTAAQALIESGSGNSKLSKAPYYNLFGSKGSYNGQSVTMKTKEYINGKYVVKNQAFRVYPSWRESIADHSSLFLRLARYANLRGEKDYKTACHNVYKDGYASGLNYDLTLISAIEKNKLYLWDQEELPVDLALYDAINVIADRVIDGRFGYGHEQRAAMIYQMVRERVNLILS